MAESCPSWESVLAALHGETAGDEGSRARAHLAGCPACARAAKALPALERATRAAKYAADAAGECPSPETLAAYASGQMQNGVRAAVEAHLAACGPCRSDVAAVPGDLAAADAAPAPSPRVLARARILVRAAAARPRRSSSPRLPAARPARVWGWFVPLSMAAGVIGGIVAARIAVQPAAPPAVSAPVQTAVHPPETALLELQKRLADAEARAKAVEDQLRQRALSEEASRAQAQAVAASLDAVQRQLAEIRALPRPAGPAAPAPETLERLAKLQDEIARMGLQMDEVEKLRKSNEEALAALAESQRREKAYADQLARLQATAPVAAPAGVALDYDDAFAAIRQGSATDCKQAMDQMRGQGLEGLGFVIAYYNKDAPKDRRKQAEEELNRMGARAVDHDLIVDMAHEQLPVRREAGAHLVKYRSRGQISDFNPAAALDERQRGIDKAIRWWEKEYRAAFPEKAQVAQGRIVIVPGQGPVSLTPIAPPPGSQVLPPQPGAPSLPVPPQYGPPKPQ